MYGVRTNKGGFGRRGNAAIMAAGGIAVHRLTEPFASPQRLSQSVVQAGELLGLYRAEVARLLGFHCADVSALYEGRLLLLPGGRAWESGVLFVRLYQALHDRMAGDGPRMVHWLRADHPALGSSPFLSMVDGGGLERVVRLAATVAPAERHR